MSNANTVPDTDLVKIEEVISSHPTQRWPLIPLLQRIQNEFGYIPNGAVPAIARAVGLFPSQIQGVVSFYAQLYSTPRGRNIVRVCRGTACHVRGGKTILKLVKRELDIEDGETTPDNEYTLETVACIGCCALAPNVIINNNIHGHMNPRKVTAIFGEHRER